MATPHEVAITTDGRAEASGDAVIVANCTEGTGNEESTNKRRRIRFNTSLDILLLQSVMLAGAHIAKHGAMQKSFEDACLQFMKNAPRYLITEATKPSWKTVNDRFKKLVSERRAENNHNMTLSGITEVVGEREQLLDDIIHRMDEANEVVSAEKEERSQHEKRMTEAAEEIRRFATSRTVSDSTSTGDGTPQSSTRSPSSRKQKRRIFGYESDEEDRNMLNRAISDRTEFEKKKIKLEEERLHMDKLREEKEEARRGQINDIESRKLALEERRILLEEKKQEMDREEKRASIIERRQMVAAFAAITSQQFRKATE